MNDSFTDAELTRLVIDRRSVGVPSSERVLDLAEWAARRLATAWGLGKRPLAERYLEQYPELAAVPAAAARLIYEEYCQRGALGEPPESSELHRRFPAWRDELAKLLQCHRMLHPAEANDRLPKVGETLGDFELQALLGRGLRGRVFLATQRSLADRPVALKVTTGCGGEHLSLARVQHPHVVPLYAFHDFPDRDLQALCMPYLGGLTLDRAIVRLEGGPGVGRSGRELLELLDEARTPYVAVPAWSAARQFLAVTTYPRAICWIAACLADALHYAHERGLVHLDIKPSNILLADDGQPMLLDFHLARSPLEAGALLQGNLGGTAGYMSPEQATAVAAARSGRVIPAPVGNTSDVYSLGAVLLELLTGVLPPPPSLAATPADLVRVLRAGLNGRRIDPQLARIVARSVANDPADRYPDAASLADALRRHVGQLPLHNRPRRGRFRRWWPWSQA